MRRRIARIALVAGVLVAAAIAAVAGLSLYSTTTASQQTSVTAGTVGGGRQPSVAVSGRDVTLAWAAAGNATAYTVTRASEQGLSTTVKGSCAGSVTATTCTDTGLPQSSSAAATTWTYAITPRFNSWLGATGPASSVVTILAPALGLGTTAFTADGGTTTASLSSFFDGETVALCLDQPTGCAGSTLGTATIPASGGAASTTLTLPAGVAVGAHTVYAVGSLGSVPAASITVAPGAARRLVFTTQPAAGVPAGTTFATSPVVTVQDAYGNAVTSDTGAVTLAIASGPAGGSLSCSNAGFPTIAVVAGVARFANCQITGSAAAGTYTLAATRSGLTSTGASSSVVIVAGTANKLVFTTQPVGGVAEGVAFATSPVVKVEDTSGNVITGDSGTVTLQIATGPAGGVLSCTNAGFPTVSAVNGVAAFTGCRITGTAAAGTYTLIATRTGLTPTAASTSVVVTVGTAARLAFTTQPVGNVAEGVAFATSPVVKVQDAYGNVVTTDTGAVTLAIATGPASGVLGCTNAGFPTVNAVAGVATFTGCQITGTAAAGTYALAATRTGLISTGPSADVVIAVGVASRLAFTTQPAGNVPEGTAFATSPVVNVQDAYGNVVTSDAGTVSLALASGPAAGVLSCANAGFPAVTAVAGVATFIGCQITGAAAAGTYTLTATRTGLTGTGASSSVVIQVGAAAKLLFTTQPVGNVLVGAAFTTSPVVAVTDAYANVVSTDAGSVTLAVASGPAGAALSCTNTGFPTIAAVAGVAAFSGCQIAGASGSFTLTATRTGLTAAGPSAAVVILAPSIRISALTGVAANQNQNFWRATVTVSVVDQSGAPASGVTVTGAWSPLTTTPSGCTTGANGQCTITTPNTAFSSSQTATTWAVATLAKPGTTYTPSANALSSITLTKP